MPKRTRKTLIENSEEALATPVSPTGVGEDEIVKDLVQGKIAEASEGEALEMALALRKIIRGIDVITSRQAEQDAQIAKLREEAAARDEAAKKYEDDNKKFIEDILSRAESLKARGTQLDKIKADAALQTADAYQAARAKARSDQLSFDEQLAKMPKVTVTSPGVVVLTSEDGRPSAKLMAEEIRIKHRVWYLQPGVPTDVPKVVADLLSNRRKDQNQTQRMEKALQANLEIPELNKQMAEIRKDEAPYDPNRAPSPL